MVGSMPSLKIPLSECFSSSINVFYTMGLNQHIPGLFYDVKADGSRAHRLLAAVENLCVQLFFQLLNHGAQGGLCDPAIFSSFGEMAELIDSKYVFQLL